MCNSPAVFLRYGPYGYVLVGLKMKCFKYRKVVILMVKMEFVLLFYCTANTEAIIFVNNQLDEQFFFMYVYFYSRHVSGSHVPIIRRINCINTTSGICHYIDGHLVCKCTSNGHLYTVTYA